MSINRSEQVGDGQNVALLWENLSIFKPSGFWGKATPSCCLRWHPQLEPIVTNLNGSLTFGTVTALMGPSGAGKSSLSKVLFGSGDYVSTGAIRKAPNLGKVVFVAQEEKEHLLSNLTVWESLIFASKIKNIHLRDEPSEPKDAERGLLIRKSHQSICRELIRELNLKDCEDTLIRNISGGQRKRLAIGQELTSEEKPNIIIMDEPTSGLNSSMSLEVIQVLHHLAENQGHPLAILVVIHQPSYRIISQYIHSMYILSVNGCCIFSGDFEELKTTLELEEVSLRDNPADIMDNHASVKTNPRKRHNKFTILEHLFCCKRDSSSNTSYPGRSSNETAKRAITQKLERDAADKLKFSDEDRKVIERMDEVTRLCSSSFSWSFYHFWHLLNRGRVNWVVRQKSRMGLLVGVMAMVALLLVLIYDRNVGKPNGCVQTFPEVITNCSSVTALHDLLKDVPIENNVRFLFFYILSLIFTCLIPTLLSFPEETSLFLREKYNGWYSVSSYYLAKVVLEFCVLYFLPLVFSILMYMDTNQLDLESVDKALLFAANSRFKRFIVITQLTALVAQAMGLFIGIVFHKDTKKCLIVGAVVLLVNILLSGFFKRISLLPQSMSYLSYATFTRFSLDGVLVSIYGFNRCVAPDPAIQVVNTIVYKYQLEDNSFSTDVLVLGAHLVAYHCLTFLFLCIKSKASCFFRNRPSLTHDIIHTIYQLIAASLIIIAVVSVGQVVTLFCVWAGLLATALVLILILLLWFLIL